jgi:hypothetical protein
MLKSMVCASLVKRAVPKITVVNTLVNTHVNAVTQSYSSRDMYGSVGTNAFLPQEMNQDLPYMGVLRRCTLFGHPFPDHPGDASLDDPISAPCSKPVRSRFRRILTAVQSS